MKGTHVTTKRYETKEDIPKEAQPNVTQIYGERIGKLAILTPACGAVIFDSARTSVLVTRRSDNGRWCTPGGGMDPGESAVECCVREVLEETGLVVQSGRLLGVYSSPNFITEYADGNRRQSITLSFEAEVIGGNLCLTDETTEVGYYSLEQMKSMDMMEPSYERIVDAFASQEAAFVR